MSIAEIEETFRWHSLVAIFGLLDYMYVALMQYTLIGLDRPCQSLRRSYRALVRAL